MGRIAVPAAAARMPWHRQCADVGSGARPWPPGRARPARGARLPGGRWAKEARHGRRWALRRLHGHRFRGVLRSGARLVRGAPHQSVGGL